ncbi:hypothetical protein GIB67_028047 [Kingdonia uniflora]|uniref:Uncharacterized protein n=1 Tax=Kingdonia uniflora TaxID=39325 RepID=A0A7J7L1B3_9MAGN|nr:hypothetical protein GIB67_028047 [Kingdonia uniflora]
MVSTFGCAKDDEIDLVGHLSPIIGVGDEEDIVAELVEWSRLKGSRVEYLMGCSQFREFCKAKSCVDGIWGHAFGYRGNFFRTCSVRQGGDYLYLLPDLAKEKKYRHLGDEVSLEYVQGVVKESQTDGFYCYLAQFDYGLTLPLGNLAKSVMNMIGECPVPLNYNFCEVILVCETLNERWAASGSESRITAKDFLEYYVVKYVTTTDGAYLTSSSSRPCFFDLFSTGRVWNDNLLWVSHECHQRSNEEYFELNNITIRKGISYKVLRKESFIDFVTKEGTEFEVILKKLGINMFKRVASKDDKVRRSQANKRMAGKTPDSVHCCTEFCEEEGREKGVASCFATSDSVDDSSKRRKIAPPVKSQVMLEENVKIAEGANLRPRFEVETGLMEEQCRAKAREKGVTVAEDEFKKFAHSLRGVQLGLQDREAAPLKLKEVRAESVAEAERLGSASATSQNNLAGKLYQLRYTKAEILALSEGNYEEKEIVDEEEVEEMEDGLNVDEKTVADNLETIYQEIESLRLRVVDLEGLLEVEKSSFADLQLISWPVGQGGTGSLELAEEYEALISQYEDQLDDNVKLSLKLEEANSQVEDKTAILLSRDLALNELISELG